MKTFTKTIEKPRLIIKHDNSSESPREWDNLGYFLTNESQSISPDGTYSLLYDIMIEAEELASNTDEHIEIIKQMAQERQGIETIIAIYPIYRYEHGNSVYRRGTAQGFDYSNCGFYIVTKESQALIGTSDDRIEAVIDNELETYTKWANGEVYGFILYDEAGEHEDSCWGFYDIDDIKDNLPDEWKDENMADYLEA